MVLARVLLTFFQVRPRSFQVLTTLISNAFDATQAGGSGGSGGQGRKDARDLSKGVTFFYRRFRKQQQEEESSGQRERCYVDGGVEWCKE